jgi:Ca2+-binding RTX toxin-like protein
MGNKGESLMKGGFFVRDRYQFSRKTLQMKPTLHSKPKTLNQVATVVFVDAGVDNYHQLVDGVIPTAEVFVLDTAADGIEQISQVLQQRQDVDAVHIVSHGAPGCLYLGNTQLSLDTFNRYATQLQQWDVANLLLYGCNVAAGDAGAEFVAKLQALTGAEIAASKSLTGSAAKGGNWELEVTTAKAVATLAFEPATLKNYSAILGTLTGAGAVWDYDNNGSGIREGTLGSQSDAYDGFFQFTVNGQFFSPGSGTQTGQTFTTASQTLSGLNVTAQYIANQVDPILQGVYSLANPTGSAITVPVRWGGNLGSDNFTFIKGTSSGDTILDASDSWVVTDDYTAAELGDPTITHYFSPNASGVTRTNATLNRDNLSVDYTVTIPAFSTISLQFSNLLNGGNVNQAPTDLNLSNNSINENVAANSTVGTFTSTDPNAGNTFTYSLVSGTGSTDNSAFTIVGNQLRINASPDFETKNNYSIRVRTTDQGGLSYEEVVTVNVNNLNEQPTALSLSNTSINENVAAGSTVGTFSTTDPDTGNIFTYSLVSGTGSTDNSAFTIVDNQLRINASPDFETKNNYSVRVRTTDQAGLSYEEVVSVNVNNLNEQPTALSLSNTSINENVIAGSTVGTFSSTDPDTGNTFTYSLVSGTGSTDNSAFTIVDNQLRINASPDFETKNNYSVRVRTTDQGGLSHEEVFTVNVNDIDEFIYGTPGADILRGTASADQINGLGGNDRLYGEAGNDTINGDDGDDLVYGGDGNDYLLGGNGSDRLYGDAGNDRLFGDAGNDILYGGAGDDLLYGGAGSDRLYGDAGRDTFVLQAGMGTDTIYDFEDGVDLLRLDGGLTFGQLNIVQRGSSTQISDSITGDVLVSLYNTNSTLITQADFTHVAIL